MQLITRKLAFITTFAGGIYYASKTPHFACFAPNTKRGLLERLTEELEPTLSCQIFEGKPEKGRSPRLCLRSASDAILSDVQEAVYLEAKKIVRPESIQGMTVSELQLLLYLRGKTGRDNRYKAVLPYVDIGMKGFDRLSCNALVAELDQTFHLKCSVVVNTDSAHRGLKVRIKPESYNDLKALLV